MKILFVFGTRPEAIKVAPLIKIFSKNDIKSVVSCSTGQHREMLDQVLELFKIEPSYDLNIMRKEQTLADITSKCVSDLTKIIERENPSLVLVQGDTTSAFCGALAAFYNKIPIGHIEAGLRTNNIYSPWPEEGNRRLISTLCSLHFTPTKAASDNLLFEGVPPKNIYNTGNTVVDALEMTLEKINKQNKINNNLKNWLREICPQANYIFDNTSRLVLITGHRRENIGNKMENIFSSINTLACRYADTVFIFPVHLNPQVNVIATRYLSNVDNIILIQPVKYLEMVYLMMLSYLIITDSGGIQEEAPSLQTPVLVTRSESERPEGIDAGCAIIVGDDKDKIERTFIELMENEKYYKDRLLKNNPYGDGKSSKRIFDIIQDKFDKKS